MAAIDALLKDAERVDLLQKWQAQGKKITPIHR
jgi:hypothetical protein